MPKTEEKAAEEATSVAKETVGAGNATDLEKLIAEAKTLGIKIPRTSIAGFRSKKPGDIGKEEIRVAAHLVTWLKIMIAKAKANSKMKPIDKRRELLLGRMRAVKARDRAYTYSDAIVKAWLEELNMINNSPRSWNKATSNGTKNYTPSSKRKKSALDILDGMDLE